MLTLRRASFLFVLVAGLCASCGRSESEGNGGEFDDDAEVNDGPTPDVSIGDSGQLDGGPVDLGAVDSGRIDGGRDAGRDGGRPDAGRDGGNDGGRPDSGRPDAGRDSGVDSGVDAGRDGGRPDGGRDSGVDSGVDSGLQDTGPSDTGIPDTAGMADTGVDGGRPDGGRDSGVDSGIDAGVDAGIDAGLIDGGIPCIGVDCSALDGPCSIGLCNPLTNMCFALPFPDGLGCDDMNACTSMDTCQSGLCTGTSTSAGDTCATAIPLPWTVGSIVESGNTACAADDGTGTCVATPGAGDVIYEAQVDGWRRFVFRTTNPGPTGFDTYLYLRSSCGDAMSELACDDNGGRGNFSRLEQVLEPGTHFLYVDGAHANDSGDYSLSVDVDPQDTCAGIANLTLPPPGMTTEIRGTTIGANDTWQASCAGAATSPDHAYRLMLAADTRVRLETLQTGLNDYDTALYIHGAPCTPGMSMEFGCDDDAGFNTLSRIETLLTAGTYTIIVDGWAGGSTGDYRLALTNVPPSEIVNFPSPGDARLTQVGTTFSRDGDFVEGVRSIVAGSVSTMQIEVDIVNMLTCDRVDLQAMINGLIVGTFSVFPNTTHVSQMFFFGAQNGPPYALRYEVTRNVMMGCGSIDFNEMTSTVELGN